MIRKHGTRIVFLFLVPAIACAAVSPPAGAQAWEFGKNKVQYKDFSWSILKTPHFDIYFNEGYRTLASRTAVILEYGYNKLSGDFSHNIPWRIPVILYGSHSDFQQTNVTWSLIPEGVQAFAEPLRKRMVLHYGGSNVDFAHTTIHELVHIFTFDIVYGSLLKSVFSRNLLFQIPLWFAEGLSEFYSVGYDSEVEMFMRDATVFDYLMDLDYTSGYMVYKSGQAAVHYIYETYGRDKVIEIMDHLNNQRSMELALRSAVGMSTEELSRDWQKFMRRTYWPLYADKKEPEFYGRRLTDHYEDHNYMNNKPAFSPDGEYIVFFSDRKGLDGIYLMNVVTGEVEKKLLIGSMSTRFESIRSMKSRLTYSPDGTKIAFVAKSDGRDKLFLMGVPSGKIAGEIELPLDFFYSPAWSPDGDRIVLVGTKWGQTDLYVYHVTADTLQRVTRDIEDESDPVWFPDGERIAYCRYRRVAVQPAFMPDSSGTERIAGIDFQSKENVLSVDSDIWKLDLASGTIEQLIETPGNESDPIVLSDDEIVFTSDESGISNLYRGSLEIGSYFRFTDVLGGIFSTAYSAEKDRLVFSAMNMAGYDLFIMDGFSGKSRLSYSTGGPAMSGHSIKPPVPFGVAEHESYEQEVGRQEGGAVETVAAGDTALAAAGGAATGGVRGDEPDVRANGRVSGIRTGSVPRDPAWEGRPEHAVEGRPAIVVDEDSDEDIHPDTLEAIRERLRSKIGTVQPYEIHFSPDYVGNGMGLFFSTGFGFGLMNQIAFSDLLGDHHLFFSFNIYRSLEDSDFVISYYYLKRRVDYAVGLFQFKNYLSSRVSSIGEAFLDYRFFTERNYGLFGLVSFPFSTFTRFDLEFQGFMSEREFFEWQTVDETTPAIDYIVPGEKSKRRLFQPTISLVHDSAYFGSFGPVIGSRWMVSLSRSLSFSGDDISRTTAFIDFRKYLPLFYRNYLAARCIGAVSTGDDPRFFFLGGPLTMRGYDYLQFSGPRALLLNLEYRYPLVDAVVFGWPGRWGIRNIGGTLFIDTGSVWGDGMYVHTLPGGIKPRTVNDLRFYSDFGLGFYMRLGFLILNFQLGWPTDFSRTGGSVFHFYLGPQF